MTDWKIKYFGHIESAEISYPEENWMELKSLSGYKLATYRFHRPHPKALVCIFHGLNFASCDLTNVAQNLYSNGCSVIAFDYPGHGKSEGPRGNMDNLEGLAADCEKFLIKALAGYSKNTPVFLLGESMGGALCVMVSMRRPELIRGVMLFAPALGVSPDFEPVLQKLVCCLNFCCGGTRLKSFDPVLFSRNPYFPNYFRENPEFFTGRLNVRTAAAMLNGLENLQLMAQNFRTPVIVFQGGMDKITSAQVAKEFIENCKSDDKEFLIYDDMFHCVAHEPEISEILIKCTEWIDKRIL